MGYFKRALYAMLPATGWRSFTWCAWHLHHEVRFYGKAEPTAEFNKNRTKLLIKWCTVFTSCFAHIVQISPSGTGEKDKLLVATARYNNCKVTTRSDDFGLGFKHPSAYIVLIEPSEFQMAFEASSKEFKSALLTATNEWALSPDAEATWKTVKW